MDLQLIIVVMIVAACVAVAAVKLWRALHGMADCGCGAGKDCRNCRFHNKG